MWCVNPSNLFPINEYQLVMIKTAEDSKHLTLSEMIFLKHWSYLDSIAMLVISRDFVVIAVTMPGKRFSKTASVAYQKQYFCMLDSSAHIYS